jgi:hypothetical protein
MFEDIDAFIFQTKLLGATVIGGGAFLADLMSDTKGWDEMTLKVVLGVALIYISRLFLQSQKDHKQEMQVMQNNHKLESRQREDSMRESVDRQASCLERLVDLTQEQVDHFRTFVKTAVDDKMKH